MLAIVVMAEVKKFEKKKTGFVLVLEDLYKKYFHISPVLVLLESTKADFWLVWGKVYTNVGWVSGVEG